MELTLRGLLKTLALPPGIIIVLLLLGWLLGRKGLGRFLSFVGIAALYLLSTGAAVSWLAGGLERYPPAAPAMLQADGTQAILVLLADMRRNNPELGGRAALSSLSVERMQYALRLHRETGLPLVLSGGALKEGSTPVADLAKQWLDAQGVTDAVLAIENESANTWENLANSAAMLDEMRLSRVALVTHAWHMKRAMFSAEKHHLYAIPAPTHFMHKPVADQSGFYPSDWMPRASALADNYLLLHEYLGNFWYRWEY